MERLACAIAESEPIAVPGVVLTEILLGLKHDAEAERIASLLGAFDAVAKSLRGKIILRQRGYIDFVAQKGSLFAQPSIV